MKEKDLVKKSFYQVAGVDIDAGNRAVELIKKHAATTRRPGVLGGIGGFAGLFALDPGRYREPVLVSGTDGVGTKLRVAQMMGKHDTVGIDLVAMCVNDILVCGAEPLFFLDYLACSKLVPEQVAEVVAGIAAGCREAGCALIGGETAEMPGFYRAGEYDLAGFAVGVVERDQIWDGGNILAGDAVLGIASTGLHSNGYSLARRVLFEESGYQVDTFLPELGRTVGEELLLPTRIYAKTVLGLKETFGPGVVKGTAHITGGGLLENIPRVLPGGLGVVIRRESWRVPPVFELIQARGKVPSGEMYRVFNMGIGFVLFTRASEAGAVKRALQEMGETVFFLGEVQPGSGVTLI
ncbi:MAG: phosphoribosylformylglycinamidine cyclo-ligase [Bacillota bacterium]|jgi:phosphoribosylformylglycinamidine cyclo-ligase|nr:phosphoribosylformylglycinamidine cyclo-ligase [Bacillota bacterium]